MNAKTESYASMPSLNVLSVASEVYPLIETGGLADVAGALPGALEPEGVTVRSLMPGDPGPTTDSGPGRSACHGAVPVVSRVGGLTDPIVDPTEMAPANGAATDIMVSPVTATALETALPRTAEIFHEPENWAKLIRAGMATVVSWRNPARRTADLYRALVASPSDTTASAGASA